MGVRVVSTGPPPVKQLEVARRLRARIAEGVYAPGSQLPAVPALAGEFGVAPVTMQKVLARLRGDGLLHSVRRRGTFVSSTPPHRHRVGLVFPAAPGDARWSKFAAAIQAAADRSAAGSDVSYAAYYRVSDHPDADAEAERRLLADVSEHRLRGLLLLTHPGHLRHTPLIDDVTLPRVGIMSKPVFPSITALHTDWAAFTEAALAHFRRRGRCRIGIITTNGENHGHLRALAEALAATGAESRPYWQQAVPWDSPAWARNAAHAMFVHGDSPDALIVTDDHLVESCLAGLADAGRRPGDAVDIVVHCNFPNPPAARPGVRSLGFDAGQLLATALELFACEPPGPGRERLVTISPVFADTVAAHPKKDLPHVSS
jgi:DNA-binding LacI/PurR family transcriptional regulator